IPAGPLGDERHRGQDARPERRGEKIRRRERFAAPVIVDGRIGRELDTGWTVHGRAAQRAFVSDPNLDQGASIQRLTALYTISPLITVIVTLASSSSFGCAVSGSRSSTVRSA